MIVVTGAGGQLGQAVMEEASERGIEALAVNRTQLDIADSHSVQEFFTGKKVDCIVNCAAWTAVDAAEDDPAGAMKANSYGPWLLGRTGLPVIHVSTDYVFPGTDPRPRRENDPTCPLGVYGISKLMGEDALKATGAPGAILRTAWVYSLRAGTKNFAHTILRLAKTRPTLSVVNDQVGSPTLAEDLAVMILTMIERGSHRQPMETFHCVNSGQTSWRGFAQAIVDRAGLSCEIKPITTAQYPTKAKRPAYSVLDTTKFQKRFGFTIRSWQDALQFAFDRFPES